MIWEARGLFSTAAAILIALSVIGTWDVVDWHHQGTETALDATVSNLQSQIDMLKEELKGASPTLAAIQARRANVRKEMLALYVESGPILTRMQPDAKPTDGEVKQLNTDELAWEQKVSDWLNVNFGAAAKERFLEPPSLPYTSYGTDPRVDATLNRLANRRGNLTSLIESSAYDQ